MATSIFDEKTIIPDDSMVATALADKKNLWDKLEDHVLENYKGTTKAWKFYSKKSGWTLVFKKKNRTLLYFIPCKGYFKVLFVFGEKAVNAVKQSTLPGCILDTILAATAHAEGRSFFVCIKDEEDLQHVLSLLKIKDEI